MKPSDLNRAVARLTGESVDFINRMGFQLIETPAPRLQQRRRHRSKRRRQKVCQAA